VLTADSNVSLTFVQRLARYSALNRTRRKGGFPSAFHAVLEELSPRSLKTGLARSDPKSDLIADVFSFAVLTMHPQAPRSALWIFGDRHPFVAAPKFLSGVRVGSQYSLCE
jgi:hypothetical protein